MALDPTPWGIGGGAAHYPETVRQALHDSTGGSEGVSTAGALRVAPTAVPGGKVRALPGGALLLNRYQGGAGQTYAARNASQTEVPISPTGSGAGRTDLIVLRILDPQYEGEPPEDPTDFNYTRFEVIEGVPAKTETFEELNLDYPAIELSKVTLPKSTATVTAAMLTNLRNLAQPRTLTVNIPRPNVTNDAGMELKSRAAFPVGEWFPNVGGGLNNGRYDVKVPKWATRMHIRCEWLSIKYKGNPGQGSYWVTLGPGGGGADTDRHTQSFGWDSGDATERVNWVLEQPYNVLPEWRGGVLPFFPRANRSTGSSGGYVGLTTTSGMVFSVRFLETAEL